MGNARLRNALLPYINNIVMCLTRLKKGANFACLGERTLK